MAHGQGATSNRRGGYGPFDRGPRGHGKDKSVKKAEKRANDPRYQDAMDKARADQKALDDLIAEQQKNPAIGPVAGAMFAAQRKAAEEAAAASQALVAHKEVHLEIEAAAEPVKVKEPVVKAPKAFTPRPFAWRKKLPEFGDDSKQESFAETTARIMAKTGYNIAHICKTTHVGWGDLDHLGEWDEDGYLIFDLGGDDDADEPSK